MGCFHSTVQLLYRCDIFKATFTRAQLFNVRKMWKDHQNPRTTTSISVTCCTSCTSESQPSVANNIVVNVSTMPSTDTLSFLRPCLSGSPQQPWCSPPPQKNQNEKHCYLTDLSDKSHVLQCHNIYIIILIRNFFSLFFFTRANHRHWGQGRGATRAL